jgi:ectoine hydroxylase-related dioxygenase (phytanoyl-CoA dioxygenase family)
MPLQKFDNSTDASTIIQALRRDGAVVVSNVAEHDVIDAIVSELRAPLDNDDMDAASVFDGNRTLRTSYGMLGSAPSAAKLVDHDLVIEVANDILLPHCSSYNIGSMTAIEILPGESAQALHRDDSLYPIDNAGMELLIGVMWALDDFTIENGGTRVVPGSHRFLRSWHLPDVSDWESAEMPKGSVLFYMGSTWHGGGANQSDGSRLGLINTYSLGWLRQESNAFLDTPPEVAAQFEPRLRSLIGYSAYGSGDDNIGCSNGQCAAWVDVPPVPEWREARGQIGSEENAKAQSGE